MGGGLDFRLGSATGWCIGLVCGYFAAFAVTAAQLTVIYSRGARFRSFHGAFLALSALWLPMRVFILSMNATEPGAWGMYTVHGLYFLPTSLQYASFSIWGMYLHSVSRQRVGLQTAPAMLWWYGVSNIVLLAANVVEIVVLDVGSAFAVNEMQNAVRGTVEVTLCTIVAVYGMRFARLPEYQYHTTLLPRKPVFLHVVNGMLVVLFGLRALYDFISLGPWHLPAFPPVLWYHVLFFSLAELLPLALLLAVLPMPHSRGHRSPTKWDPRFPGDVPERDSQLSDSAGGNASARLSERSPMTMDSPLVRGDRPYGDEADLFLYATDDSVRRGLPGPTHAATDLDESLLGSEAGMEYTPHHADRGRTYSSRSSLSTERPHHSLASSPRYE